MKRKPLMRKGKIRKSSKCSCYMCKGHKEFMSHAERRRRLVFIDSFEDNGACKGCGSLNACQGECLTRGKK